MLHGCLRREEVGLSPTLLISPQDTHLDYEAQIREHFSIIREILDLERSACERGICQAAFTFVTNNIDREHWEIVNKVRKEYWGDEKPTSTFIQTARRPDNRPWGNSSIGFDPVVYYNPPNVTDYYIEGSQFLPAAYCHAKRVETDKSRELYFSGMCGVAGDPDKPENPSGIRIIANTIYQQAHSALMYCEKLRCQAGFEHEDIHTVDIFYVSGYDPAPVARQTLNFFGNARINVIPVTALFMPGVLVEIRPHATVWK